ncbi:hypothetical protein JX265_003457 [Neoarthrinium moseri]|uniref:Uncharacterized protein n=1 Tax=Neoarthrinium moseri TaxID=1658444 RepID=A0A9P9WS89_9PEZI|nr:hypothetical protein JX265_003457 [Neoarthrinium moseri]
MNRPGSCLPFPSRASPRLASPRLPRGLPCTNPAHCVPRAESNVSPAWPPTLPICHPSLCERRVEPLASRPLTSALGPGLTAAGYIPASGSASPGSTRQPAVAQQRRMWPTTYLDQLGPRSTVPFLTSCSIPLYNHTRGIGDPWLIVDVSQVPYHSPYEACHQDLEDNSSLNNNKADPPAEFETDAVADIANNGSGWAFGGSVPLSGAAGLQNSSRQLGANLSFAQSLSASHPGTPLDLS